MRNNKKLVKPYDSKSDAETSQHAMENYERIEKLLEKQIESGSRDPYVWLECIDKDVVRKTINLLKEGFCVERISRDYTKTPIYKIKRNRVASTFSCCKYI